MKTNQWLPRNLIAATAVVGGLVAAGMTIAPAQADEVVSVNENAYGNTCGE